MLNPGADPGRFHGTDGLVASWLNPGAIGQQVEYPLDLDHVWSVREDLPALFGTPDFLWVDGDGNAPTYWNGAPNAADIFTATGTPSSGEGTPWRDRDGDAVTAEEYDAAEYRRTATNVVVAANEDLIVVDLVRGSGAINQYGWGSHSGASGWLIWNPNPATTDAFYIDTDTAAGVNVTAAGQTNSSAWRLRIGIMERGSNSVLYVNGIAGAGTQVTPAGAITGSGLTLNGNGAGAGAQTGACAFRAMFKGVGLAAKWLAGGANLVTRLTALALGYFPEHGDNNVGLSTFTRASAAMGQGDDDTFHLFSSGMPRAGRAAGLTADPAITNYCFNTIDRTVGTGWAATGGVLTHNIDDSTAMAAGADGDCSGLGRVSELANATGVDQYLYSAGPIGVTTACHLMAMGRMVAGSGARLGWRDASAGTFTDVGALEDDYALTRLNNTSPPDTDCALAIKVPNGCTVRSIGEHAGRGAISPAYPIPNYATAGVAAGAADEGTTPWTVPDSTGAVSVDIEPIGWDASDLPANNSIISQVGAPFDAQLIYAAGTLGGRLACYDGTNLVQLPAPVLADGIPIAVRLMWHGADMRLRGNDQEASSSYDGAWRNSGGALKLPARIAPVRLRHLRCYRRAS